MLVPVRCQSAHVSPLPQLLLVFSSLQVTKLVSMIKRLNISLLLFYIINSLRPNEAYSLVLSPLLLNCINYLHYIHQKKKMV